MTFKLPPRIAKPVFVLFAVVMFGLAFWTAGRDGEFFDGAARVSGRVIDLKAERVARGPQQYHPVVRFTDPASGRAVTFDSGFRLYPSPYDVGDEVTVAYDPAAPQHAEIDSFWIRFFYPLLMAILGAASLLAAWISAKQS